MQKQISNVAIKKMAVTTNLKDKNIKAIANPCRLAPSNVTNTTQRKTFWHYFSWRRRQRIHFDSIGHYYLLLLNYNQYYEKYVPSFIIALIFSLCFKFLFLRKQRPCGRKRSFINEFIHSRANMLFDVIHVTT